MDLESLDPLPDPDQDPTAPANAAPATGSSVSRRRPLLLAGAGAALALAVGGFAVGSALANDSTPTVQLANTASSTGAAAGTNGARTGMRMFRRGRGAAGKVASISGTSFVVNSPRGNVTVQTDGTTTFAMETTGKVADAKVGAHVLVHGTAGATNTILAQQLVVLPAVPKRPALPNNATPPNFTPRFGTPPNGSAPTVRPPNGATPKVNAGIAVGTVVTNDGSTLTISARGTTITVNTNSSTVVLETVTATFASIKVGDVVAVTGPAPTGNGTAPSPSPAPPTNITASHVNIVPAALVAGSLHAGGFATFPAFPFFGGGFGHRFGPGPGSGIFAPGSPGATAGQSSSTNV